MQPLNTTLALTAPYGFISTLLLMTCRGAGSPDIPILQMYTSVKTEPNSTRNLYTRLYMHMCMSCTCTCIYAYIHIKGWALIRISNVETPSAISRNRIYFRNIKERYIKKTKVLQPQERQHTLPRVATYFVYTLPISITMEPLSWWENASPLLLTDIS